MENIVKNNITYSVFVVFANNCWRRVLPLKEYDTLQEAIEAADTEAKNYKYKDQHQMIYAVSTHRDGEELYKVSSESFKIDTQSNK